MVGKAIAVIDIGTNSFHLLIAKIEQYGFEELLKTKQFVKLADQGIDHISDEKFALGLQVLKEFKQKMEEYEVAEFRAFGTAGMRSADNSDLFREQALEQLGIAIEVIDGDREAELIYKGVSTAVDLNHEKRLIMDIGGGSTEFIIANESEIFWKHSYPIGANVLMNRFHRSDPISNSEYRELVNFLEEELSELWKQIKQHKPIGLIGASGSFVSLVAIQRSKTQLFPGLDNTAEIVNLSGFRVIHLSMLRSNLIERLNITDLEPERAPMMPVATTLMSMVINHMRPNRSIVVSFHALKEGMLKEMRDVYYNATQE